MLYSRLHFISLNRPVAPSRYRMLARQSLVATHSGTSFIGCTASVICTFVRHAILSTPDMQSFLGLCKNRPVAMYTTGRVCARVSERACTEPMYCTWIFMYFMIAANTQWPNISHAIHDMHLACKQMANVFRRPPFYLLQGFARGRTHLHTQMYPGGHNCITQQSPGGHDCICKTVRRTLLHMQ